jgi:biotin carboxylase
MNRPRPRLLVLDALGGPHPRVVGPSLSPLAELDFVCVPPPFPGEREERLAELARWGTVTVAADPPLLVDQAVGLGEARRFQGVFCQSELLVLQSAIVASELGLPGQSVSSARRLTDKRRQRDALAESAIATPRWCQIASSRDFDRAKRAVTFPAVLKPATGMGGTSVTLVETARELAGEYGAARAHYLRDPRMAHLEPVFLLEELIAGERWVDDHRFGDYVSVESIVSDAETGHLAVTDKLAPAYPFRETGDIQPSSLPAETLAEICELASAAIRAVGFVTGAAHTEIKLTPAGPRVIEVNGRVGGPVPYLLRTATGFDVLAALGTMALGGAPPASPRGFERYAGYFTPQSPARPVRVEAIHGIPEAQALAGVRELIVDCVPGAVPDWRMGERARLFRSWLEAPTLALLLETYESLLDRLRFELAEL